ncbi:MAG: CopG family transcriptional regulator [Mycobacteriaceae bacterium]|nr:CopG family transcriptional regulator [Mycobacteriaceae bacterium]
MGLKKTTVMVDENDLAIIKRAARREGKPESEYFREAFHIAALRAQRWTEPLDLPQFSFGKDVTEDDVRNAVQEMGGPE